MCAGNFNFIEQIHIITWRGSSLRGVRKTMGNTKDGRSVAEKWIKIDIVLILLLSVVAVILAIHAFAVRGLFGYSARIVMSTSMEKNPQTDVEQYDIGDIPARSFVLIKLVPSEEGTRDAFYAQLREGDVLTFVYQVMGGSVTVTHRICGIEQSGGGYVFTLRGDNGTFAGTQVVDTADPSGGNRIVGKVVCCSPALGVCVCIMRDPLFWLSVCIAALAVMLLGELLRGNDLPRHVRGPSKGGKYEK